MNLFNRSISINVQLVDEKSVRVNGCFLDSHHEICLTLGVDIERYTINSATGEFRRAPHTDCEKAQILINSLVGINLNNNVRRQIQKAVGIDYGCTHLVDLTLECVKGLIQAKFQLMHLTMPPEEIRDVVGKYLEGSCLHYKKA
ncbi:DUF2889 domain-containing protein [Desulfosporosinus sp. Sb-LF]|uniref:DUF2889 domain-containing protein n=1 Tax=Desulfosporosinus sp. Sb-LF TaxID=2560027 RepID=UPI00107EF7A1|nr:DUF2889 domain-containing protein [Desulfosporosinus sp. Sb-LF]TGE34010.1 DUF2889 domain-containing protein [Desulfosporosinus sp. Sb-LF]